MNRAATILTATAALAALLAVGPTPARAVDPRAAHLSEAWASDIVNLKLLNAIEDAKNTGAARVADSLTDNSIRTTADGNLLAEIIFDDLDDASAANFAVKGTTVLHVSTEWKRITVELTNPDAVYTIARLPGVRMVRPVYAAATNAGIVTSQAVHALRSNRASNRYGVNGTGQKVGVISDSFARTSGVRDGNTTPPAGAAGVLQGARNQDSGDLPAQVQILKEMPLTFGGASDEGAGMAELVHDIVPGAAIAFHTAYSSESEFADGITALRSSGCTVVVDDIIYYSEPMFQEGVVAQSARDCVAAGVPYFSSAGNNKNTGLRFNFRDTNPAVDTEGVANFSTDDYHRWDNGTSFIGITALPFNPIKVILQWSQPFDSVSPGNGSQIDLDMVFYSAPNSLATVIATANDLQGTTGAPKGDALEIIDLVNTDSGPRTIYLAINHVRGMQDGIPQNPALPLECRLVVFGAEPRIEGVTSDLNIYGGPTQYGHSIATGVMGVGAIPWYDTPAFDLNLGATPQIDAQDFTSLGGNLRLYFNDAGALNVRDRLCPDIAATNGENTTFFGSSLDLLGYQGEPDGFPNFFGTSAAAPNAAAVAALMKSLDPSLTPDEVRQIMTSTAIDVTGRRAAPGVDDTTGAGLVDAQAALDVVAGGLGITPVPTPAGTPAPKFRRVFSGSPEPDLENPSDPLERDFSAWEFVPGHGFFPPSEGNILGSPVLITNDNTNTFGFFQSPYLIAGPWQRSGDLPLNGNNGAYNLYRADFTVRTSVAAENQGAIPTMRFRATTESNEQSDMLVLTSNTTENISPNTAPYAYRLFFALPVTQKRFRVFYEVINVGGTDVANANLILDRVEVSAISVSGLIDQQAERTYSFRGPDSLGWEYRDAQPTFGRPRQSYVANGLRIGPSVGSDINSRVYFGYYGSPEGDGLAVRFEPDRLYRARFLVHSDLPESATAATPTFRLRVNDESMNFSAITAVESISNISNLPYINKPKAYDLYFETIPGIDGNRMLLSFDYILAPGLSNSPSATITLEQVEVTSFQTPLF